MYERWQIRRQAARRLTAFPDSPHTVIWLAEAGRLGDALDVLERVIARQPGRVADALQALDDQQMHQIQRDQAYGYRARLINLLAAARRAVPTLDRETAATLDIALVPLEAQLSPRTDAFETGSRAALARHEGTTAARLASVDITDLSRRFSDRVAELDAIAAREPASVVAAKARYTKAFQLAHDGFLLVRDGAGPDPTDRLLEVLAIVADLESGRYPPCRWVDDAPDLVASFGISRQPISPANAARLLDGLRRFVVGHEALLSAGDDDSLPYVVTKKLPAIAAFLPDGVAAMERLFVEFDREWRDKAAARYLRARWLDLAQDDINEPLALAPRSATHEADIRALLASASAAGGDSLYARRALARLADREFSDPASLTGAHAHFSEYLRRFPAASDAWLIALRLGQVEQALGRHGDAARRFADVARASAGNPIAYALASAYAARASEESREFAAALSSYRAALAAWTPDVDDTLTLDLPQPPGAPPHDISDVVLTRNPGLVTRAEVDHRVRELTRSLAVDGGPELEYGRWLMRQERPREAVPVLERVASRYARSTAGADAAGILSRARLDAALSLVDAANPSPDAEAALRELAALSGRRFDANSGMAGILGATLTLLQGRDSDAEARLTASLRRWVREGTRVRTPPPRGSLAHDVLAVRDAVFLPLGDGLLAGRWNGFAWPATLPPFLVAPPALRVKVSGRNTWTEVEASRQPPGLTNVVFVSPEDIAYLSLAVSRLGGTRRRQPTAIMEVPNQPIGDAQTIIRWWNRFFPARPGHWAGFEIATYPVCTSIEFTNAARTRALVPVTIGYAGAELVLEKVNGVWTITEVVNQWVT